MPSRLVIATHNRKKAGEMLTILSERFPGLELLTLADFEGAPEPEEIGTTYAENAAIKAKSAAVFTGEWSLADDAGLEIDALDGAPGLYSKRFGGEDLPFPEKIAMILSITSGQDLGNLSRKERISG
ncbi:non-canonical purine NTP pyrophosphatase [bacterium]|nr:MAG: non-canonical purine NTP pyrophosphatase [bacterium]